jgi:hypothetical protein
MTRPYYVAHAAIVSGAPAWLLSRIMRSPNVKKVLSTPPLWVDRAEVAAAVDAIHRAAKAFETASGALERDDGTVRRAADYLGLSERRVQERAIELGGRKVGRQWILDEVAVRQEYQRRRQRVA